MNDTINILNSYNIKIDGETVLEVKDGEIINILKPKKTQMEANLEDLNTLEYIEE